jgi:hypothetical protein
MSNHKALKDPFYAQIIYMVEEKLHESDKLAATRGITLSDSAIRSALVRAMNEAEGKQSKTPPGPSPKDQFLAELVAQLAILRSCIDVASNEDDAKDESKLEPLPRADWIIVLDAIKESCAIRTSSAPASRDYLDYIATFLAEAQERIGKK